MEPRKAYATDEALVLALQNIHHEAVRTFGGRWGMNGPG